MSTSSASPPLADAKDPPATDEVELSVFGPGVGESILVHVGNNEWVVVDSCIDADSKRPPILEYLERVGVRPADRVKLIVATHWHDDHVRGLSTIVREVPGALFSCSAALRSKEFYSLLASRDFSVVSGSDVEEMATILKLRAGQGRENGGGVDSWASDSTRLYQRAKGGGHVGVQVFALSPSAAEITLAQLELAKLIPKRGMPKRRIVSQTANEVAVALHFEVGDVRMLLGSDVEAKTNHLVGWKAIVASRTRPQAKADSYKVAHHGSYTGHEPRIWTDLLTAKPIAVLTPFSRSALPTADDIARLLRDASSAFLSAPTQPAAIKRSTSVQRMIGSATIRMARREAKMGQIRMRWKSGQPTPRIEVFGSAHQLS